MKNTLYKIYIGKNDKNTKTQLISDTKISQLINNTFKNFGINGYTAFDATGVWKGGQEKTIVIEVMTNKRQSIKHIARSLKYVLNQESILITKQRVKADFI